MDERQSNASKRERLDLVAACYVEEMLHNRELKKERSKIPSCCRKRDIGDDWHWCYEKKNFPKTKWCKHCIKRQELTDKIRQVAGYMGHHLETYKSIMKLVKNNESGNR